MAVEATKLSDQFSRRHHDVVVVGSGPVGMRFVEELRRLNGDLSIAVFGDEPWQPYNRVKLSALVSGQVREASLYHGEGIADDDGISTFYNNRIVEINRYNRQVLDSDGRRHSYRKLVLATGSRPHVPVIDGVDLTNVFTFRDLSDAQSLVGRSVRSRRTVILGGGLLGLEAARAMQRFNTEVVVVEHSMWLMFRQLDNRGGNYLKRYLETLGISVRVSERVLRIAGEHSVAGVELGSGEYLECDTVILATGIDSNSDLARKAGLYVGKGIRVNDSLQTNDRDIYAIGECAEHDNKMYGLVAPGFEQAAVLAHHLVGERAEYHGSTCATNLKVLDYPVFSAGNTGVSARSREVFIYQDHQKEIYRKLVVIRGRLRGAIGIGEWPGVHRIQEAVEKQRRVWPWQLGRFTREGLLWNDAESENVGDWPPGATVCNCTGVTRGQLDTAFRQGAETVAELASVTGASTVCGSCKHLLTDFIGGNAAPEPTSGFRVLMMASVLASLVALAIFMFPGLSFSESVQAKYILDPIWLDNTLKQISGYTLLGVSLIISMLSLRKRFRKLYGLWDYAWWRVAHVVVGVLLLAVLLAHTGFRLGDNLNLYLMIVFSALLLVGALAGAVIASEHNIPTRLAKRLRTYTVWLHILLLWPLPALLGFHILKTYYF